MAGCYQPGALAVLPGQPEKSALVTRRKQDLSVSDMVPILGLDLPAVRGFIVQRPVD
ncbi:MAG: hypothetical protein Q7T00_04460 [Rugosibacter sp.]|nr:hypothetical protein [Rugosibacter sp.]